MTLLVFALAIGALAVLLREGRQAPEEATVDVVGPAAPPETLEAAKREIGAEAIRGRIVDLEGRPLSGVLVRSGQYKSHSDEAGTFVAPRGSEPLLFSKTGFFERALKGKPSRSREASVPIQVILIQGGRVNGRVRAESGPATGARLLFHQAGRSLTCSTADDGSFRSPLLRAGDVRVEVLHPSFQARHVELHGLRPGEARHHEFTLEHGTPLNIRVQQSSGEPVPDAALWLQFARAPGGRSKAGGVLSPERFLGRTDDLGRLTVHRPPGPLPWIRARAVGFHELAVPAFQERTVLKLRRKPSLSVQAVDADNGLPVPVRRVYYEQQTEDGANQQRVPSSGVRHDGPGRFRIDYPERAKDLLLVVDGAGNRRGAHRIHAHSDARDAGTPGRDREPLLVYLRAHGKVEGRIFGPERDDFPIRVDIHIAGPGLTPDAMTLSDIPQNISRSQAQAPQWIGDFWQTLVTDAQGRFQLAGLGAGSRLRLRVQHPDFAAFESAEFDMEELAAHESLPIVLLRGRRVLGKAVHPDGSAASHIRVILERPRGHALTEWTDERGAFAFENVSPGQSYRLSVSPPGSGSDETAENTEGREPEAREVAVPHDRDVYYRLQL